MAENSKVRAPYNFVPFSQKVLQRYESAEELPRHDRMDPNLRSGEIHVTMEADTPVFVSDGRTCNSGFYCTPNGDYALSGSAIRGMVRENMQILGFGCVRPGVDFEDIQIYYREMAAARGSTGGSLKRCYQDTLGIMNIRVNGKWVSIPKKVCTGYLRKENGGCYIQPVAGKVLQVSREHPDLMGLGNAYAQTLPVGYTAVGDRVEHIQRSDAADPGMAQGMLLFTGKPVGKPNGLYLFPKADEAVSYTHLRAHET